MNSFATLYAASPNIHNLQKDPLATQVPIYKKLLSRERQVACLPSMITDVDTAMRFDSTAPVDVFAVMYRLIYQLTHRALGCKDFADDEVLLQKTLRHYSCMDECSPWQILFPELPTPAKLTKRWKGLQLFLELRRVMHKRRRNGAKSDDAMQVLMDDGKSDVEVCAVSIAPGVSCQCTITDIAAGHHRIALRLHGQHGCKWRLVTLLSCAG